MSLLRPVPSDAPFVNVEGSSPSLSERWLRPFLAAAIGVTILTAYLAGGALGVGARARDEVFSLRDDAWLQSSWSALDSPFAFAWLPSSAASRASIAIALGRKSALRDFGAAAAAATVVVFAAWLFQNGLPLFPALLATFGLAFGATCWTRGTVWTLDALAPLWALAAAMAGRRWLAARDVRLGLAATAAAMLAVVEDPSWIACLPAAGVWLWRHAAPASRSRSIATLIALFVLGTASLLSRLDATTHAQWAALLHVDAPSVWAMWSRLTRGGWAPLSRLVPEEVTALGEVILVAGVVAWWRTTRDRLVLATLAAGVVAGRYLVPQLRPEEAGPVLALASWAAIAKGLEWLGTTVPAGAPVVAGLVGVLFIAQPSLTRVRMAALHELDSPLLELRTVAELKMSDLPPDSWIVATGREVDSSIHLSSALAGLPIPIVPQRAELIESAFGAGRPLRALPSARARLESAGFLFDRTFAGNTPLGAIVGRQACTVLPPNQWMDVSLQLASAAFSVQSEAPAITPGQMSVYLAAPHPVMVTDRERLLTPYESMLLPGDAGAEARRRLGDAMVRGGGMQTWPVTVIKVSSSSAPTQATFSLSEVPQATMVVSTISPSVTLCAVSAQTDFTLDSSSRASSARLMSNGVFGVGWHSPEGGDDTFRWTASGESSMRAIVKRPEPIRLTVTTMPAAPNSARPRLGLAVNACELPDRPLPPGLSDIVWDVRADCWKAGANQLWLRSGPLVSPASLGRGADTRLLGARVSAVRLERIAP